MVPYAIDALAVLRGPPAPSLPVLPVAAGVVPPGVALGGSPVGQRGGEGTAR